MTASSGQPEPADTDPASGRSRFAQAAAIPYRVREGRIEVLLITSRRTRRWIVPKGLIEPHQGAVDAAAQEAWEEAGVEGDLQDTALGTYTYEKWGGVCHVEVFSMRVTRVHGDWPESSCRQRCWLPAEGAARAVRRKALRRMILELGRCIRRDKT